jgi:hypothetical protein
MPMTRLLIAALAGALLGCGTASAQVGAVPSAPSPLGMTSPLGIGPAPAVPPTGIPLGATELTSPGVSPTTSGTSPLGPAALSTITCNGINAMAGNLSGASSLTGGSSSTGTSTPGTPGTPSISGSSTLFDGGGTVGTASGTCAGITGNTSAQPAASASSPTGMALPSAVGRVGIPLGSTELGVGGLSPMPEIPSPNPSVPSPTLGAPCPTTGTAAMGATSSTSGTLFGSC